MVHRLEGLARADRAVADDRPDAPALAACAAASAMPSAAADRGARVADTEGVVRLSAR